MSEITFVDFGVSKDCINPDSFGEICVKCNACGRFGEDTMWEARYNLFWWQIADELEKHSGVFFRSKLQQENIAKNIISLGEDLLKCVQNMDVEKASIHQVKTFDYMGLVEDVKANGVRDVCAICKHYSQPDCAMDCSECQKDCACRECRECSAWKWRGEE